MSYHCEILADTQNLVTGDRLTSFLVTFPRMVLADLTRHRVMSFSFESTRAVPVEARIAMIRAGEFFVPRMRAYAKGMAQGPFLEGHDKREAEQDWIAGAHASANLAENMLQRGAGVEKGIAGRMIENYGWITGIISGTEWENFFVLRADPRMGAQYEAQVITGMMKAAYEGSEPYGAALGEWHLPLIDESDRVLHSDRSLASASAGRCAAISYLKHRVDETVQESQLRWHTKLAPFSHWSPAEHPAQAVDTFGDLGNYRGFKQLRKCYPGNEIAKVPE
jgi:hypothetical protein